MKISIKYFLKGHNTVCHSPWIGNTTWNYMWTLWNTMPENGESGKKEEFDTLSEWAKAIRSLVQIRINISVLNHSDLTETMSTIHEKICCFFCR